MGCTLLDLLAFAADTHMDGWMDGWMDGRIDGKGGLA
jgi:hypothetical protein